MKSAVRCCQSLFSSAIGSSRCLKYQERHVLRGGCGYPRRLWLPKDRSGPVLKKAYSLTNGLTCTALQKGWQWHAEAENPCLRRTARRQIRQPVHDLERAFFEMASLNLQLADEGLTSDNEALRLLEKVLSEV